MPRRLEPAIARDLRSLAGPDASSSAVAGELSGGTPCFFSLVSTLRSVGCPVTRFRALLTCLLCVAACKKNEDGATTPPAEPAPEASEPAAAESDPHFDVSQDRSGALARAAAVLEAEGIDNEDLRVMSHHTESLPSAAAVCQHMAEVQESTGGIKDCIADIEEHIAQLGPEIWAEASECFMEAMTPASLDACVAAEKEAEALLYDQPHGDGLDTATCESLFDKFKTLTMKEKEDDAGHVAQVLDHVRSHVVRSCMAHGTKAEVACADGATTLHQLEECTKVL